MTASPARARLAATLLAVLAPCAAHAWGPEGHRIVGDVAESLLDARARGALAVLTGGESLAAVAVWLDDERARLGRDVPGSARWHYDNEPVCHASSAAEYCADGQCASQAYRTQLAILADRTRPAAERLFALRVVVHVLGDVHQPLHVADDGDRGGNDLRVRVGRRSHPKSLHAAWDHDFVKRALGGTGEHEFADELVREFGGQRARLAAGSFADWTRESHRLAVEVAYGRLPGFACGAPPRGVVALPAGYSDAAAGVVREQLARAGFRLAAVLESAL